MCPKNSKYFNGTCYSFVYDYLNGQGRLSRCFNSYGGYPYSIHSFDEHWFTYTAVSLVKTLKLRFLLGKSNIFRHLTSILHWTRFRDWLPVLTGPMRPIYEPGTGPTGHQWTTVCRGPCGIIVASRMALATRRICCKV